MDQVTNLPQPPDKRNATAEEALRKELAEVDAKLKGADDRLRAEFPRYAELAASNPVGVADIQSVLAAQLCWSVLAAATRKNWAWVGFGVI